MLEGRTLTCLYCNVKVLSLFISVGHCHPKIIGVYQQLLGSLGTGQIFTAPGQDWDNVEGNGTERGKFRNNHPFPTEYENIIKSTKGERPKSSSRLTNRLLKTLNVPDKLETALTFSSG